MKYIELYRKMLECELIQSKYGHQLSLVETELAAEKDKEEYLKLFTLYFSLICDGNIYMSLEKTSLLKKFKEKLDRQKILFEENDTDKAQALDDIYDEIENASAYLATMPGLSVVGSDRLFITADDRLYTRKHYNASREIEDSVRRLFVKNTVRKPVFDYRTVVGGSKKFELSDGQQEVVNKGYYNNILVTGGPGTGKTTSIFFLLLDLLLDDPGRNVYLTAYAGKAASRMKDSILKSAQYVSTTNVAVIEVIEKIKSLEEYTIHRLLGTDPSYGGFVHTRANQFSGNAIFIIDEASMIDVNIFASLLEAIPTDARVFILGDKNQLPSVDCGAVYGDLLEGLDRELKVELTESKRFLKESEVYELSEAINRGNREEKLPVMENEWKPYVDFKVEANPTEDIFPIYYYKDEAKNNSDMIKFIVTEWAKNFYSDYQRLCTDIEIAGEEMSVLDTISDRAEEARILCANNDSIRGTKHINKLVLDECYNKKKMISGYFPGELLMITRNNDPINLYNGDCGVGVKFKDDDMLYAMFKKGTKLKLDEGKVDNKIFKIGDYVFYPIRMIGKEDIVPAFGITIHKAQGSDYANILVLLSKKKGHPLLNRQIVYTAITRTRGNTYILSNQQNLEYARDTELARDTGIMI